MQETCKIFPSCKNIASYLIIARVLSNVCYFKINANYLLFAGILQDIHQLQESVKESNICKNMAKGLLCATILQDGFYLQECPKIALNLQKYSKISFICKNLARYLIFARTLLDITCLQGRRKKCIICMNFVIYLFWQKHCKVFTVCKDLSRHLFFAWISQGV